MSFNPLSIIEVLSVKPEASSVRTELDPVERGRLRVVSDAVENLVVSVDNSVTVVPTEASKSPVIKYSIESVNSQPTMAESTVIEKTKIVTKNTANTVVESTSDILADARQRIDGIFAEGDIQQQQNVTEYINYLSSTNEV